jgi:hypothetical protein
VTTANLADGAVTSGKLADGSVTTAKIANDASETTRIQTVSILDPSPPFNATGELATQAIIDPSVTITVPTGKAYYYEIVYSGRFVYLFADRVGSSPNFYGNWYAFPAANGVQIAPRLGIAQTGYRYDWGAVGGNFYWAPQYQAVWLIRLEEGSHQLTINLMGYSDSSMNFAKVQEQNLQVMRLY